MLRRPRLWDCMSSVCRSVRLSVTIRYRDHTGWSFSKIISRPNNLRLMRWLTATWVIWCNGNTQNYGRIEVGPGAHKSCHISEKVQDRTEVTITANRKFYTRFRLEPKSMTWDDLERPKRHSCRNKQNSRMYNSEWSSLKVKFVWR